MNMLFTCSVVLSDKDNVQIEPRVSFPAIDSKTTQMFYLKSSVEQFKQNLSSDFTISSLNISKLRQLISGFHHTSIYGFYRASVLGFEDPLHMHVAVFTLCDISHFDGYGIGEKANATIASKILLCKHEYMKY
ncbi:hypothetical protein RMATCC62417_04476 [Rhizopus microsporus]|nr:hypothetical protein RMATCC62417_04476 [Rhizopus microsporus]